MSREEKNQHKLEAYLKLIGVDSLPPYTSPFDPGYDLSTLQSHLQQSSHLMSTLKISMACWQIANEHVTREKISAANRFNVPVCVGGGPFEVAAYFNRVPEYLDICADLGVTRFEAGQGFTELTLKPKQVLQWASERNLEVQYEVGKKHMGSFNKDIIEMLIEEGKSWLNAGAKQIVIEARESASNVGLFDGAGSFDKQGADRIVDEFGLDVVMFEAPTKVSQFTLLNHFGSNVRLSNVRLEELLRVEIYRRGLHSDAFEYEHLRPKGLNKRK